MLKLPVFSLTKSVAVCPSWNGWVLAHLVLMNSVGILSVTMTSESLRLILMALVHNAMEITI